MHQIVTKAGRLSLLDTLSGAGSGTGLDGAEYHLYVNDYTPTDDSVEGDFVEASGAWFAAQPAVGWSPAALGVGDVGEATALDLTWTNLSGSGANLYGFYVIDAGNGELLYAGRFDSAPQLLVDGQSMILTPQFQDDTIYTS